MFAPAESSNLLLAAATVCGITNRGINMCKQLQLTFRFLLLSARVAWLGLYSPTTFTQNNQLPAWLWLTAHGSFQCVYSLMCVFGVSVCVFLTWSRAVSGSCQKVWMKMCWAQSFTSCLQD